MLSITPRGLTSHPYFSRKAEKNKLHHSTGQLIWFQGWLKILPISVVKGAFPSTRKNTSALTMSQAA
ncbi:hypothetical protein KJ636_02710, partial [Patescibacteria group bacterium]|nr:hypothetical protein [Patescibacteria group bacterium]